MERRFETFSISILELNRYIQRIKKYEMKKFGLKGTHVMCLYYLGRYSEGLCAAELCELCNEDKAAISRSLAQLVEKGVVTCSVPPGKRAYRTVYHLTQSGQELVSAIKARIDEIFSMGGEGLTSRQREDLYAAMDTILANLKRLYKDKGEADV